MDNFEMIKRIVNSEDGYYELANILVNVHDINPCNLCPRYKEDRCNDDCNNGLVEWLVKECDPESEVWEEH